MRILHNYCRINKNIADITMMSSNKSKNDQYALQNSVISNNSLKFAKFIRNAPKLAQMTIETSKNPKIQSCLKMTNMPPEIQLYPTIPRNLQNLSEITQNLHKWPQKHQKIPKFSHVWKWPICPPKFSYVQQLLKICKNH